MPYYDEQDDYPEPEEVEMTAEPCPTCGKVVEFPEFGALDEDHFCSGACYEVWAANRAAEYADECAREWEEAMKDAREASCVRCHRPFADFPGSLDWCHDHECEFENVSQLYVNLPPVPCDDIPF